MFKAKKILNRINNNPNKIFDSSLFKAVFYLKYCSVSINLLLVKNIVPNIWQKFKQY